MKYAADVKGGLHANYSPAIGGVGLFQNNSFTRRMRQRMDNKSEYNFRAIVSNLLGAAPGVMTTVVYPEIQPSTELGGVRPVVNTVTFNRPTLASDVTDAKSALTLMTTQTTMTSPYNGDRNPLGTR